MGPKKLELVFPETSGETHVLKTKFNENSNQKKLLWTVLGINFAFFLIEMTTGIISKSMGLVADSLDMLADSFVYGISLFAVGGTLIRKNRIAKLAGYFQITLAIIGFLEVLRRFFGDKNLPNFSTMIIVSIFALIANYYLNSAKEVREGRTAAISPLGIFVIGSSILIGTAWILACYLSPVREVITTIGHSTLSLGAMAFIFINQFRNE